MIIDDPGQWDDPQSHSVNPVYFDIVRRPKAAAEEAFLALDDFARSNLPSKILLLNATHNLITSYADKHIFNCISTNYF